LVLTWAAQTILDPRGLARLFAAALVPALLKRSQIGGPTLLRAAPNEVEDLQSQETLDQVMTTCWTKNVVRAAQMPGSTCREGRSKQPICALTACVD